MAMTFDPFTELDRFADSLIGTAQGPKFMPVDLSREGDQYVLNADMPGLDPASVDIDIDGQLLTIRAHRGMDAPGDVAAWLVQERPHGVYLRQFNLGDGIDSEKITAHYDNGVLSLLLPITERAKPRKIDVHASAPQAQSALSG